MTPPIHRRDLLKLGAAGALAPWAGLEAWAQTAPLQDYRALVCVFLFGGNDGNNLLVPTDSSRYAQYQRARPNLALPREQLLPLSLSNTAGATYGLHPAMPELRALWDAGQVAMVLNNGNLVRPYADAADFAQLEPVLRGFAENVFHVGGPGAGHIIKLLNNFIAQAMCTAIAEAFAVGQRSGVNLDKLVELVSAGLVNSGIFQVMAKTLKGYLETTKPWSMPPCYRVARKAMPLCYRVARKVMPLCYRVARMPGVRMSQTKP